MAVENVLTHPPSHPSHHITTMATLVMTQCCHHHHHHLAPMSMMMKVMMTTANDNNRFNKMTMAVMMDPEYLAWCSTGTVVVASLTVCFIFLDYRLKFKNTRTVL
jgi:hypothetical protein